MQNRSSLTQTKVSEIYNNPSYKIFEDFPSLEIFMLDSFILSLINFVAGGYHEIGARTYVLEIDPLAVKGENKLTPSDINAGLLDGQNLFNINFDFDYVSRKQIDSPNLISCSSLSRENDSIIVLIGNGIEFLIFSKGCPVGEIHALRPSLRPRTMKKTNRPASDYRMSLHEFYLHMLTASGSEYWEDRRSRKLKGGHTELIFHKALSEWLRSNIDGRVIDEVKKITSDKSDIEIIDLNRGTYLIEVKWLGQNVNGTKYVEARILEGVQQVNSYLRTDNTTDNATLVIYDGRDKADFDLIDCIDEPYEGCKEFQTCNGETLHPRALCHLYFLRSNFASDGY